MVRVDDLKYRVGELEQQLQETKQEVRRSTHSHRLSQMHTLGQTSFLHDCYVYLEILNDQLNNFIIFAFEAKLDFQKLQQFNMRKLWSQVYSIIVASKGCVLTIEMKKSYSEIKL